MGFVIIGFIVGIGLLVICGGIENIENKKRKNMSFKEYMDLKNSGRL